MGSVGPARRIRTLHTVLRWSGDRPGKANRTATLRSQAEAAFT